MKKYILTAFLFALLLQSRAVQSEEYVNFDEEYCTQCCATCGWGSLAIKAAAIFPTASNVRNIYGDTLAQFTLEGNLKLWESCSGDFYMWVDGSYIYSNGESYIEEEKPETGYDSHHTRLSLVPITLGFKYQYHINDCFDVYLGAGPSYSFLHLQDASKYVHRKTSKNCFGAIVKSGCVYNFCDGFYLEGFLNYAFQRFNIRGPKNNPHVERHNVDLSNVQLGLGLGWKF